MALMSMEDIRRLQEIIEPVGIPSSVTITTLKVFPSPPDENKHVHGHHVGSWHFVARKQ
jgi:hypothetical protein